jgi:hypothetical protein
MKIITSVVNNPTFIEIQHRAFKKFLKGGDYEFIVFNDAKSFPDYTNGNDVTLKLQIQAVCAQLNVVCINVQNDHHAKLDMSHRHADTFNACILSYQREHPDKYLMLDSDMFLVDHLDMTKYAECDCAIVLQRKNNEGYMWPGLCYMDMAKMKRFELINWSPCPGFDTGGCTKYWLKLQLGTADPVPSADNANPVHARGIYFINHLPSGSWNESELPTNLKGNAKLVEFLKNDVRNSNGKFFCEIYDDVFLHYRAGGNWRKEGMHLHKHLSQCLKHCLS